MIEPAKPSVDVILPIYGSLHFAIPCLRSLKAHQTHPFHLHVVDDGSDPYVADRVREFVLEAWGEKKASIWTNPQNLGYLKSVNRGIREGSGDIVVLLNSDVVVTPHWLEGLVQCLLSSSQIGVVSPLANHANFTRFAMKQGLTLREMAIQIREVSKRHYPEIGIASGFCLAARRSLYESIGLFDEIYGPGYYEESDWCMRAREHGLQVVADDATYVYHHGWGTFRKTGRNHWLERNQALFRERWGGAHDRFKDDFLKGTPFAYLDDRLQAEKAPPTLRGRKTLVRELTRDRKRRAKEGLPPWRRKKPSVSPTHLRHSEARWTRWAKSLRPQRVIEHPRVLFVLPGMGPYGGVLSVVQLANRLQLRGIHAQIATCGRADLDSFTEPMYLAPFVFDNPIEMLLELPVHDVVVATRWDTVYDAILLAKRWGARILSFVQDFEPEFYEPADPRHRAAEASLRLVQDRVVKTDWLRERVQPFGGTTHKISLGLDLDVFHPERRTEKEIDVLSATRPKASFRNLPGTLRVFRQLRERRTDLRLVLYGQPLEEDMPGHDEFEHLGVLSQAEVAHVVKRSRVVLDLSLFQGFGRPGLEAMACGVPSVLTNRGGINEYARHQENCVQVDPEQEDRAVEAIEAFLDDGAFGERIGHSGLATAQDYGAEKEADQWERLIRSQKTTLPSCTLDSRERADRNLEGP